MSICLHYLHSTMYLLKPAVAVAIAVAPCTFTFHYVSIKTITSIATLHMCNIFTFHYVSIKTRKMLRWRSLWFHLHSTMYLLKPLILLTQQLYLSYLHSTMYLLKLQSAVRLIVRVFTFTFHYVSIKTFLCR